ncbi:MAG: hypothetical protein SPI12_02730 [Actinomycetaceae bacterium]|nr:hypothetical protein [Actinomycetaceae bacterium]MDY6082763.1 hypothetical protein [Actinomycetaceae bacterium]
MTNTQNDQNTLNSDTAEDARATTRMKGMMASREREQEGEGNDSRPLTKIAILNACVTSLCVVIAALVAWLGVGIAVAGGILLGGGVIVLATSATAVMAQSTRRPAVVMVCGYVCKAALIVAVMGVATHTPIPPRAVGFSAAAALLISLVIESWVVMRSVRVGSSE